MIRMHRQTFNLLPVQKKEEIQKEVFAKSALLTMNVIFVCLCTSAAALFIAKIILTNEINNLEKNTIIKNQNYEIGISKKSIESFNEKIGYINTNYLTGNDYNTILLQFVELVPRGITLSTITIDGKNSETSINGKANDRNTLLEFQSQLENSPYFDATELPLSSLTNPTDISFVISTHFNENINE